MELFGEGTGEDIMICITQHSSDTVWRVKEFKAMKHIRPEEGGPLLCLRSFRIISPKQGQEYRLQRYENVFTIKDSIQEDHLCTTLLIDDREVPVYFGEESTLPGSDIKDYFYSSEMSPD
ncbi:hypothetical protein AVEN_127430-1 [Araneus ventricosus]|uniref:Uncharacterized protein n=1 Tax=Araneus ventricosus TaxID=182803 RepID=A0A4Y2ETG2_ARAVE|nr:hypothetical protein AVEN_127430-1 [Araneus ventricosus]